MADNGLQTTPCSNCGHNLIRTAKFCAHCGVSTGETRSTEQDTIGNQDGTRRKPRFLWLLVVVIVMFSTLVWPTMYRYESFPGIVTIRVNRLTGQEATLYLDGWRSRGSSTNTGTLVEEQSNILSQGTSSVTLGDLALSDIVDTGYQITGQIVNVSNHRVNLSYIYARTFDSDGKPISIQPTTWPTLASNILNTVLEPNQTAPFALVYLKLKIVPKMQKFQITIRYASLSS